MALTEQGGGSDLRSNISTEARPAGDGEHLLNGAKWFVSAVHSDAFFVLARAEEGLSCFLVPRRLDDGTDNGFRVDRLKDKLGNRSNPTAEIELRNARGRLVGPPGHGTAAIMEMVAGTRLDCVMASAAVMRLGVTEALRFTSGRVAFGRPLLAQPLMRTVLADLALESEASTAAGLRLVRAYEEERAGDPAAGLLRRIGAPLLKYWVCKRAAEHAAESLECCGGGGYTEESRVARNYREAPLMSIWEGSGNIQALDVLRALRRTPEALDVLIDELALAEGTDRRFDAAMATLRRELGPSAEPAESSARALAGALARALQASLLIRHAPAPVSDAFCATRLGDGIPGAYGELPSGLAVDAIVERAAGEG
jgi:putative acyl-CoA dehydrogenase